jgi:hypothetical protein
VWQEDKPAGSENTNTGDDRIREFKYAIRERLATDHNALPIEAGDGTEYYHKVIHLIEQSSPTAIALIGQLYTKDVSGSVGLFFMNDAGVETRLTDSLVAAFSIVGTSNINTTANTYIPMTDMTDTRIYSAGNVMVTFSACIYNFNTDFVSFQLLMDDVTVLDTCAISEMSSSVGGGFMAVLQWVGAVTAASHKFEVKWKTNHATAYQYGSQYPRKVIITRNLQ